MRDETTEFQEGELVYQMTGYNQTLHRVRIDRVTSKNTRGGRRVTILVGECKYNGEGRRSGTSPWYSERLYKPTPELDEQFTRQRLLARIWSKMDNLRGILQVAERGGPSADDLTTLANALEQFIESAARNAAEEVERRR